MQKWWSVLFGVVTFAAVALFVIAPWVGWWMPRNVSSFGGQVDGLFYLILAITGFFFILTESLMVYFMYQYAGGPGGRIHPVGHHYAETRVLWTSFFKRFATPVTRIIHNQHRLELFWTLVPGAILLFIAIVQVNTWADIKYRSRMPSPDGPTQIMEVSARQFEWRVRYPSPQRMDSWKPGAAKPEQPENFPGAAQADDLHIVNEVHAWKGHKVLVYLKTQDVIHSLYFPNLRLKQDALPGKVIPVWFEADAANTHVQEQYTDNLRAPREGGPWLLYNGQRTDQGYRWVKWADGYEPATHQFKQPTQVWELACAELCGWGHYKMQGRLYVHEDEADFLDWLRTALREQNRRQTLQ